MNSIRTSLTMLHKQLTAMHPYEEDVDKLAVAKMFFFVVVVVLLSICCNNGR